jgi:hypothetical protein
MNKEFINYELALELKQLGFDEPCVKFQWIDQDKPKWMGTTNSPNKFHTQKYWTENNDLYTISIPTFSQCFRWFREKHNLFGQVNIHTYFIYNISNGDFKMVKEYYKLFETYEEVELACLKKLIEIVKGGNK